VTQTLDTAIAPQTIYDKSVPGRFGVIMPALDVPEAAMPADLLRDHLDLPEVSELQVIRHFVNLSSRNYAIDKGFYPLGSCTMKYNPKVNENAARLPGYAHLHPLTDDESAQGALALMHTLQGWLAEVSGFAGVSLAPAAGAQGELAGILMIRAYHHARGDHARTKILVPNSAHGTNPATVTMAGLEVVELPSDANGDVDLAALRAACNETIAGMMITVPSTLGVFDTNILQVVEAVHACGGLMYMDGANMNALLGIVKPGELGFDVMHYNLHKTFSTPHGGGGPGCGAVGVNEKLLPYLPGPIAVVRESEASADDEAPLYALEMPAHSIGRLKAYQGNFGMFVRAYTYIRTYGGSGLFDVSRHAVLNANYIRARLRGVYPMPVDRFCAHEFVMEGHFEGVESVHALDISKRLMDYGFHPPTNYFPLIVPEALLIEPTETEDMATLDEFIEALIRIADEAKTDPTLLTDAPHVTPVGRLDEVRAAKQLVLCCRPIPAWDMPQAGD
jgi:glycine dehydrogenase subunit 2